LLHRIWIWKSLVNRLQLRFRSTRRSISVLVWTDEFTEGEPVESLGEAGFSVDLLGFSIARALDPRHHKEQNGETKDRLSRAVDRTGRFHSIAGFKGGNFEKTTGRSGN